MGMKKRKIVTNLQEVNKFSGITVRLSEKNIKLYEQFAEENNLPRSVFIRKQLLDALDRLVEARRDKKSK